MSHACKQRKGEEDKRVDQKIIGSLLYLMASRLDIMFSICMCARFQSDPRESHLLATKRIFRYLAGTQDIGLWCSKDSSLELIAYSNSDYG